MEQSKCMARLAYQALDEKKGEDIKVIDISQVSVLADYFIIANGNSESQVRALVDNVEEELAKAGYDNILAFNNGKEAWDYLQSVREDQDFEKKVSLIITDIEMPEMDGHRLTKLVKEDQIMKDTPLIIFSSLINPEMRIKGKSLGADEQLSKPEIGHLVEVMDTLLGRRGQ